MRTAALDRPVRLVATACAVAASVAGWPRTVAAHEVGTTAITATLAGSRYAVEITLDPVNLLAKLDAAAGRPRAAPLSPPAYRPMLELRADEILQHALIFFDDRPVKPTLESIVEAPTLSNVVPDPWLTAPRVHIRLTGAVPRGARAFRWSYDLAFASYAFIVKRADGPTGRVEWLEGGQSSTPFEAGTGPLARFDAATFGRPGAALLLGGAVLIAGLVLRRSLEGTSRTMSRRLGAATAEPPLSRSLVASAACSARRLRPGSSASRRAHPPR